MLQQSGNYFCWETFMQGWEIGYLAKWHDVFFLFFSFLLLFRKSVFSLVMYRGGEEKWGCYSCGTDASETILRQWLMHCKIELSLNVGMKSKCNPCVFTSEWVAHKQDDTEIVVHSFHVVLIIYKGSITAFFYLIWTDNTISRDDIYLYYSHLF